ncbi:unnamed protein product [Trichogramma brassicae]|uniref:Uncharacterized protein n=1 Tax=Trichogramma brassicae TaxID=86971 RepID=A0A6H5IWZ2_9HYME|nr:unnamed protein product [Trichogramma brassicae]
MYSRCIGNFLFRQPPGEARGGRGGENDGDQAAERRRLALAVLPALEQLPNEPHQRVRSAAAAVGELRRRDARLRREFRQGSQDGTVGLQPVLPDALLRQPVSASDRHHEGHQVAGAQCRGRVHVQGRDQRVAGTNRAAAKGRRDPEDPGLGRRRQRAQARQTGRGPAERDLGEGGARAATRPQQHRSAAAKKAPTHELAGAIADCCARRTAWRVRIIFYDLVDVILADQCRCTASKAEILATQSIESSLGLRRLGVGSAPLLGSKLALVRASISCVRRRCVPLPTSGRRCQIVYARVHYFTQACTSPAGRPASRARIITSPCGRSCLTANYLTSTYNHWPLWAISHTCIVKD